MVTLDSLDLQTLSPEKLGELLIDAKKAYYTTGKPIMDDHTYDTLEEILRQKAPYHRLFAKIGHPNFDTGWTKKKHSSPMCSQNKVTNFDDLVHYFELKNKNISKNNLSPSLLREGIGGGYVIQPKCDGISLEINYHHGELVEAITRGDGFTGDIITQNVIKMKNFVLSLPKPVSCSVRCEIVVTKKDFAKLNVIANPSLSKVKQSLQKDRHDPSDLAMTYSNPRNAASGLAQRLDSQFAQYCTLMAVDISPSPPTELEKIDLLTSLGFTPVETIVCSDFTAIENIYQQFLTEKRQNYQFEIDGLVIKLNNLEIAHRLGLKNNRPQFQVAYKFPASSNQTTVKNIVWQVGPMGTVTPVGEVEPIELSGAIISFASLGNHDLVKKMDLNIGDIIEISRRGDVIPHIEKIITKVNPGHVTIPTDCPSCGHKLISDHKLLRCPNTKNCLDQIIGSLNLFCQTLDILGLSDKTIAKLYRVSKVRLPGDFYTLTVDDIKNLDNLGEKSAKNIIHQIQSKKTLSLAQIFDAAVIPNFSHQRIIQLIALGFDTPDKLLNLTPAQIESLPGFQQTLATKVWQGIQLRRPWIESILSQVNLKLPSSQALKLSKLSFAITGDLSMPRPKFIELIESYGGKFVSAVSENTDYLLTNDTDSKSAKFITAKKLNIPIISEIKFNKLLSTN